MQRGDRVDHSIALTTLESEGTLGWCRHENSGVEAKVYEAAQVQGRGFLLMPESNQPCGSQDDCVILSLVEFSQAGGNVASDGHDL